MILIAEAYHKQRKLRVYRDEYGHWYVKVGNKFTQKKLTAAEIVRWLINAMHSERENEK